MRGVERPISRRRLLQAGAALAVAGALGGRPGTTSAREGGLAGGLHTGAATAAGTRVLFRNAAIADGLSAELRRRQSILVANGRVEWIRPSDSEPDPGPSDGLEIVNATGLTVVPGLVDAHCHVTSPGGLNYIERFLDPPRKLLRYAERNGELARQAGTAWLRDVGSPVVRDPRDGKVRALAIGIRERWRGDEDRPRLRVAGTWIAAPGGLRKGLGVVVRDVREMIAAANRQLDQGADLVKLYVEAKSGRDSPWTAAEIKRVSDAVHARGARITAHASWRKTARAAVLGDVDAIEHGFRLDAETCAEMARRGTYLVTTLTVPRSWLRLGRDHPDSYWATRAGRRQARDTLAAGEASADLARRAGVKICAGTDFGGGSPRAGELAWEVESLVAAGLQPWQALGSATWRGGELLGIAEAGRIREGGRADFFLVDGDPLSDPAALWRVVRLA